MTSNSLLQVGIYLAILIASVKPLGWYMARVYEGKPCGLQRILSPIEKFIYKICNIQPEREMNWKSYASAMLFFNMIGLFVIFFIQRLQGFLPLNPAHLSAVAPDLAFNTAASFASNTDWQAYSGESTMSYFTQMLVLAVHNFLSAATGMAILVALIRGIVRRETSLLGNFWVDTVRGTLYILLPLACVWTIILMSQGVIQNFHAYQKVSLTQSFSYQQPITNAAGQIIKDKQGNPRMQNLVVNEQTLPMGPVASQIAIKQLGSNGGGYFNTNSAHPFENPTPLSNFFEMLALLLIPAALCYTFGIMVQDKRQGWAILVAMFIIFIPLLFGTIAAEQHGNPILTQLGINQTAQVNYPGGNMEGKEMRFGIVNSAIWATATTAASNGSVNAMMDSFTPVGGLIPLWLMQLGEVIFGGVGSGLYGMLMLVIITVFVAGLMVGRTPEYLGKKIEAFEMKMAAIAVLVMPLMVLIATAFAVLNATAKGAIANPGAHGFSEILYAFSSMANNNGSAFAGLNANLTFYNLLGGLVMLAGRYWIALPILAIAGSLAKKKAISVSAGTLQTHTLLFVLLLVAVVIILGALTFFPALALGPIVEQLKMLGY